MAAPMSFEGHLTAALPGCHNPWNTWAIASFFARLHTSRKQNNTLQHLCFTPSFTPTVPPDLGSHQENMGQCASVCDGPGL